MIWIIAKAVIAGIIVALVSEVSNRHERLGAFLLTLPIVSILAFLLSWQHDHDLAPISRLAKETLILVPLGLPFFVPLAFAGRLGLGFWSAFVLGVVLASAAIGAWLWWGPRIPA